jgi:hypothetical protein
MLAYFAEASVTKKKVFNIDTSPYRIIADPVPNVLKLFMDTIYT